MTTVGVPAQPDAPPREPLATAVAAAAPSVAAPPPDRQVPPRWVWESGYIRALLITDFTVCLVAAGVAFTTRFGPEVDDHTRWYVVLSVLLPLVSVAVLGLNRAYDTRFLFVGTEEYQRVFRAGAALTAVIAVLSYAFEFRIARGYVVVAMPLAVGAGVATRFVLRRALHRARGRGEYLRRAIVVGHECAVVNVTRQLRRVRYHGLDVIGACLPEPPRAALLDGLGLAVHGTFADTADVVRRCGADTVIVLSCPEFDGVALRRLAWRLERDDVDLIVASALLDVAGDRTTIRPVDGLPMLHVDHPRLTGAPRLVKQLVDVVGATACLVLLAPLFAALALVVRHTSAGPALFRQVRVGKDGREFVMYKFRTMYIDAEQRLAELRGSNDHDGVLFKMRDDPRVTRVGRVLRRFSLDELPQLFNVVRGQMSLVGPRPPLPAEVAGYPDDMRRRLVVKPGLTGLWQVSGRADLSWEESIRLDLRYVENWSLTLDVVIMLRTLTAVARSSGAY